MSEGSSADVGSAADAKGADIRSFSSQFFVLGEPLPAGVNEWLTIRNLVRGTFTWLRICRYDIGRGSKDRKQAGRDGRHKRQYRGGRSLYGERVCFAAQARIKKRC
jgi:hypothetical protein